MLHAMLLQNYVGLVLPRGVGGSETNQGWERSHLSGESTEKRSVLYISSKMEQAQIYHNSMEKIDALGWNA